MIAPLIEQEAARAGFESGETVSITDLLYGMALPSGADATMAIVDYVSGNEETFVALMNQKAKALGMNHTSQMLLVCTMKIITLLHWTLPF